MNFTPPFCPNEACPEHAGPRPGFWVRHGYYQPKCRRRPIARLRCKTCRRTFSRQTFRHDYRDHRPACNARLLGLLVSGVGLRQSARELGLGVSAVQRKFRKLGRTCRRLHRNLSGTLPANRTFVLDEEETYEKASIRPLTMPVLIERVTYFVVATMVGPIRRLAPPGTLRRWLQDRDEDRRGPRRDRSRSCVRATLRTLRARVGSGRICLLSDQKASYHVLAREAFGRALEHVQVSSRLPRDTCNALFPINLTLAMTRDNCGRLRRQSWLVTEKRRCLQLQLHLFTAYRNYVRRRHNKDAADQTPAVLLGLLPRRLRTAELLAWRQDWGARSIHPTSATGTRAVG
jgi:transposase-like protein